MALTLYCHLGKHLLLQLEAFISNILLKLAEGKGVVKIEQQEAALEVCCEAHSACAASLQA